MQKLDHPNIISFKEVIESEDSLCLVMEAFNNLSLADYLKMIGKTNSEKSGKKEKKKISEESARVIMGQIFSAFGYLHSKNIIHRDVKLENILISIKDLKVKLIDFGFSVIEDELEDKLLKDYCGTPNYIAPEIVKKRGYEGKPADIWSLGILLFGLVTGTYPFKSISEKSDFSKVQKLHEYELSDSLKELLS